MGIVGLYLILGIIAIAAFYLVILIFGEHPQLKYKLVFFILPFNALIDLVIGFISPDNPVMGTIRGVIIILYIIAMMPFINKKGPTKPVYAWLLYLIPLLFFSTNFSYSLSIYLKMATGYMMLPIGYTLVRDRHSFKKMCLSVATAACIYVVGFFIYQIFNLGVSAYVENGFRTFGGGQAQFTQVLVYACLAFPFTLDLIKRSKWKLIYVVGHILAALIVVLVYHRSSIFALILGGFVLAVVGYRRTKIFKYVAVAFVGAFIIFQFIVPSYYQNLVNVSEQQSRSLTLNKTLSSEGARGSEIRFFLFTFSQSSITEVLFGQQLFNGGSLMKWYKTEGRLRPLHIDYVIVLFGAGIIGFILYGFIYYRNTRLLFNLRKYFPPDFKKGLTATYFSLLIACLVMSSANQIWSISSLSVVFLYFGGLIGYANGLKNKKELMNQRKSEYTLGSKPT